LRCFVRYAGVDCGSHIFLVSEQRTDFSFDTLERLHLGVKLTVLDSRVQVYRVRVLLL